LIPKLAGADELPPNKSLATRPTAPPEPRRLFMAVVVLVGVFTVTDPTIGSPTVPPCEPRTARRWCSGPKKLIERTAFATLITRSKNHFGPMTNHQVCRNEVVFANCFFCSFNRGLHERHTCNGASSGKFTRVDVLTIVQDRHDRIGNFFGVRSHDYHLAGTKSNESPNVPVPRTSASFLPGRGP